MRAQTVVRSNPKTNPLKLCTFASNHDNYSVAILLLELIASS